MSYSRILTYLAVFAILALLLVGLRYETRHLAGHLDRLDQQVHQLRRERAALSLALQRAQSPLAIRTWALQHHMLPFSQATKYRQSFQPLPPIRLPSKPHTTLEIVTSWK